MDDQLSLEKQIEERLEEKVRTRIELTYIREQITMLHKRIDDHMNAEERERQQLMSKIDKLQWLVIASLAGIPANEILQRLF